MKNNRTRTAEIIVFSRIARLGLPFLIIIIAVAAARAQTVSLTSGGFAAVSGQLPGTPMSTQSSAGAPLESHVNFGDVVSTSGGRRVRVTVPVRVSATTNYKIEIQRAGANGGFDPQHVGFGIINARAQTGANPKLAPDAANVSIAGNFAANPALAPVVNGAPQFAATLANFGANPSIVLTGAPTVAAGALGEDDNSILLDLTFVVVPQYFERGDLSALNLILLISPNP